MDTLTTADMNAGWISTHNIPDDERRHFWLNHVNKRVIQVDCPAAVNEGIEASLRHLDLDRVRLNQIRANTHSVQRSQADIVGDSRHSVFLCFMLAGQGFSYQGTHGIQHAPGDIILYDTLMPYGQGFPADMEMLVMDMPEPLAKNYLKDWQRGSLLHLHRDTRFSDTSCAQLFKLLEQITNHNTPSARQASLTSELLENIESLIANTCGSSVDQDLWRACQRHIMQHLQDDNLTTEQLAKDLNISVRKLHRTFADKGASVKSYIWQQRLEQCRKALLAPSMANRNISEIAFAWGFNDAAHFSRRYKAAFGESPMQTRQALQHR